MANKLKYKKCTKRELRHCITWVKRILKLKDWKITLIDDVELDDCYGTVDMDSRIFTAVVRLDDARCKRGDISLMQILVHELIHIATFERTNMSIKDEEFVSNTFEYTITCLYLGVGP